jgi:taurine dioxygenase
MRHTSTTGSEAPFVAMPFNHEAGPSRHEINGSSRPHGSGANDGKSTGREASGFGAQIVGLCLNDGVDSGTFGQLYQAFLRHQVLLFRDQSLTPQAQVEFGRQFGTLQLHVMNQYHSNAHPELYRLSNLDADGNPNGKHPDKGTLAWHTDGSWERVTGHATLLYAEAVPPAGAGGQTHFCDMYAAYKALAPRFADLTTLRAVHSLDFSRNRRHGHEPLTDEQRAKIPPVDHPVVRVHPETGRRALYLGDHAETMVGTDYDTGRALVEQLNIEAIGPERVLEHAWREGDLMVWDNRCVQHRATSYDTATQRRVIRRCTVVGESPQAVAR